MFTPNFSTDPAGDKYDELCWLNLIKYRPFVEYVVNAYESLTDREEIPKKWKQFSSDLLASGKIVPGNLRRKFERVGNYNKQNKKET